MTTARPVLKPGLYFLRLRQESRSHTSKQAAPLSASEKETPSGPMAGFGCAPCRAKDAVDAAGPIPVTGPLLPRP